MAKKKSAELGKIYSVEELNDYFAKHDLHCDISNVMAEDGTFPFGEQVVDISIEWGDWKHEHGYCKQLMKEIGYVEISDKVTEEDGSDCYSAIHRFVHKDLWDFIQKCKKHGNGKDN